MRRATTVTLLCLLPLLAGIGNALQAFDPPQYAEVARRMFVSGDRLHLRDAASPFLNKGPFTFWLINLAFHLFGVGALAVRLPSVLAAGVTVWAVGRIAERLWDRDTADVARILGAANVALHLMVVDPKVDAVLTATITLAILCAVEARTQPRWAYLAWVFAGLGFLTKGPLGIAIPAAAILPEALRRRWGAPVDGPDGSLWQRLAVLRPVSGVAILVAMGALWLWPLYEDWGTHGPYFILWDQSFGRIAGTSVWKNSAGPLYLVHTGVWAYLPATPALLIALATRLRGWVTTRFRLPPDERRIVLWWFLLPFVVISASKMKLPQYAYWVTPAATLLAARALVQLQARPRILAWLQRVHGGVGALLAALVVFLAGWCFPPAAPMRVIWPLIVGATLLIVPRALRTTAPAVRVAALLAAPIAAFHLYYATSFFPAMLEYQPDRAFAEAARTAEPGGHRLALAMPDHTSRNGLAFWAGREVPHYPDPASFHEAVRAGEVKLAVLRAADLAQHREAGLRVDLLLERDFFPTSRPSGAFLRASTRATVVDRRVLARVGVAKDFAAAVPARQGQASPSR